MFKRVKRIIKKNKLLKRAYETASSNLIETSISEITPLNARTSTFAEKRLNLLVPSINQEHLFGGISTALDFFEQLSAEKGIKKRIILTDASPSKSDLERFKGYQYVDWNQEDHSDYQIVAFNDRFNKTIPIGKDDIFITTAWWTAYLGQRLVQWQSINYEQSIKNLVYFIQDFEPGFYQWSSHYVLADSTYRYKGPQIAVFNSSLLMDYFEQRKYNFQEKYFFEPRLNKSLMKYLPSINECNKKKQIIIYGRPSVKRNAFILIIETLRTWAQQFPDSKEWKVISLGEKHPNIEVGNGLIIESFGKVSLEEYATKLIESAVGISLMVSPHPSYPPLEMAHFGLMVLTNDYENKDLSSWHQNIHSVTDITPENLSGNLTDLCNRFSEDEKIGIKGISNAPFYTANQSAFSFVDDIRTKLFRSSED